MKQRHAMLLTILVVASFAASGFSATNEAAIASTQGAIDVGPTRAITAGQRVFTAGNSFHAWYIAPILQDMATNAGFSAHRIVGVSKIGGSGAIQHWDVPEAENEAKAALRAGRVDVLTLACMLHPDDGIDKFAQLAVTYNPNVRVVLQEFWIPWDKFEWPYQGKESDVDFDVATSAKLRELHEPYFREMDAYVTALNVRLGKPVVLIAPVGQCVVALREKITAGQVPGITRQSELFTDKLGHPHAPIEAMAAYCNFAVIYRRSPVGLSVPEVLARSTNPRWRSEELNRVLQQIAWDAVTQHPLSGVTTAK